MPSHDDATPAPPAPRVADEPGPADAADAPGAAVAAARRRLLLAALDGALTTRSADDSDVGWSQGSQGDPEAELRRDRPPHWRG